MIRVECENGHRFRIHGTVTPLEPIRCSWCRQLVKVKALPPEYQIHYRSPEPGRFYGRKRLSRSPGVGVRDP